MVKAVLACDRLVLEVVVVVSVVLLVSATRPAKTGWSVLASWASAHWMLLLRCRGRLSVGAVVILLVQGPCLLRQAGVFP